MTRGITNIEVMSGTRDDTEGKYEGFITITVTDDDGVELAGQLSVEACRFMALHFLEVAEAAEQDAMLFRLLTTKVGMPVQNVVPLVEQLREMRGTRTGPKEGEF